MAEYSRLAQGVVTSNGGATPVLVPFEPTGIRIFNSTRALAASGVTRAGWLYRMGQGAAELVTTSAGPADGTSYIPASTGGGFFTFSGGLGLQYGPQINIASVTKASPAVVTTAANHGLVSGDVVILQGLYQTASTGMPQICGIPFVVTVTGATTFTINWNTNQSNFTAYNFGGGAVVQATLKRIMYPALFAPGVAYISAISLGASTTVTTTAPHNYVVGQEIAFRIPQVYGTTQLNSLPNPIIPGQPIYAFVAAVPSSTTFLCFINSSGYGSFNSNQPATAVNGLQFAQVVAVGDANTGTGLNTSAPYQLKPTAYVGGGTSPTQVQTGPIIAGAFFNTSSQGFVIGASVAGQSGDSISWEAFLHDIVV